MPSNTYPTSKLHVYGQIQAESLRINTSASIFDTVEAKVFRSSGNVLASNLLSGAQLLVANSIIGPLMTVDPFALTLGTWTTPTTIVGNLALSGWAYFKNSIVTFNSVYPPGYETGVTTYGLYSDGKFIGIGPRGSKSLSAIIWENGSAEFASLNSRGTITAGSISTTGALAAGSISTTGTFAAGSISTTGTFAAGSISTTGTITVNNIQLNGGNLTTTSQFLTINSSNGKINCTAIECAGEVLTKTINFTNVKETKQTKSVLGDASVSINLGEGSIFEVSSPSLNINTFTLSNLPTGSTSFTLIITQGSTPRTVNWSFVKDNVARTIKWPDGEVPVVTQTANKTDIFVLYYI